MCINLTSKGEENMKSVTKIIGVLLCAVLLFTANIVGVQAAAVKVSATSKLTATATADTVKLTWSKVSKATGYRVYKIVDGKLKTIKKSVKSNKYTVEDLTAGETYKFAVTTYRTQNGKTYWSSKYKSVTIKTKAMSTPKKPTATSTKNTVTLKWAEVPGATGYRVFQYKNGEWVKIKTLSAETLKVSSLKENKTYKFKIRPYAKTTKKTVWGNFSPVVSIKTTDKTKAKFTTPVAGTNEITLYWGKVENATGYRVNMLVDGEWVKVAGGIKKTNYKVTKLESNTEYTFMVRAYKTVNGKTQWFTKSDNLKVTTKKAASDVEPTTKPSTEPTTKPSTDPTTKPNTEHTTHTEVIVPAVKATCTSTGLTEGKKCSVCNLILVAQNIVPKTAHTYTETITTQATCKAEGVKTFKCSCGNKYTEKIAKKAHTIVADAAVEPTCAKEGLTAGEHCSVCNTVTVAQQTVAKKQHTVVDVPAVEATCSKAGLTAGKSCSVCGTAIVAQQTVAKKEHTIVVDPAVEATCLKTGLTEGKHCSVCNTVTVVQQTVSKKVHIFQTDAEVEATCTSTGLTQGKSCSLCGFISIAQNVVPMKSHTDANKDGKCDVCKNNITSTEPSTPPTTEPSTPSTPSNPPASEEGLTAYRIAKYKTILDKETVYFKISSKYSETELIPVTFARKNGNMYMATTAEGINMKVYYEKKTNKMQAYAYLGVWWYYDVPENEMADMNMTEMLEEIRIKNVGDISVSRTTFNGKSVIKESFYDSKTGYTMNYYFNGETMVGIKKEHPKKVDEVIYIDEISNTVNDDLFDKPLIALPLGSN